LKPIVIVGLGPQGLFLLRQFASLNTSIYCISRKEEVGRYSKFGKIYCVDSKKNFISTINTILNTVNEKPKCYITGCFFLKLILEEFPELFNQMEVIPSNINALKIFTNKISTYELANSFEINTPKTYYLSKIQNQQQLDTTKYPLIAKWNESPTCFEYLQKTWLIENFQEITKIKNTVDHSNQHKIIVQEYIEKGREPDIAYGGYFIEGKEIIGITVHQLRQFPVGISSYVQEISGKFSIEVKKQTQLILEYLHFTGFAEAEFRICKTTNKIYLLEINPRPWGYIKILKMKYPQINKILINPYSTESLQSYNNNCKWFNLLRDLRSIFYSFRHNIDIKLLINSLNSYKGQKIFDIMDIHDMGPFIGQFSTGIKLRLYKKEEK
jgi:predicted ATP-grasp superfamily ATP-dependent carboligase